CWPPAPRAGGQHQRGVIAAHALQPAEMDEKWRIASCGIDKASKAARCALRARSDVAKSRRGIVSQCASS
ncbi:hypothetical protein, partial [Xanthomonas fragariae]|uniref:hypothetical protein n=1 Tax=Xanthomonas fragariae TaxID=48664 RepID=UPI001F23020F